MIVRSRPGRDSMMSTTRMIQKSTQPPKKPEIAPVTRPMSRPTVTDRIETHSDARAPQKIRDRMSRPWRSVPSRCWNDGGWKGRVDDRAGGRVVGRDERGEDRHEDEEPDQEEADHRRRVADEAVGGVAPQARALDRLLEDLLEGDRAGGHQEYLIRGLRYA